MILSSTFCIRFMKFQATALLQESSNNLNACITGKAYRNMLIVMLNNARNENNKHSHPHHYAELHTKVPSEPMHFIGFDGMGLIGKIKPSVCSHSHRYVD